VQQYRDYIFGLVSDVEFPWEGKLSPEAGFELARMVKSLTPDVPVVLQTSRTEFRPRAHAVGYSFLRKRSPTLLKDLRRILTDHFGFGDFVFRMPDQREVGRAADLNELEQQLQTVPAESLLYHAQSNHFSHWLMARTEFALAAKLRPRKVSDFNGPEHLRRDLIESINDYRREQNEVLIGDFKADTFKPSESSFLRVGSGSLGGKARGLAFVRHLLRTRRIARRFPGVRISVPPAVVLATDMFDEFLAENNLSDFALHCDDDGEIQQRFLESPLPVALQENLRAFLEEVRYPVAVRSSSLLEDSQYQPFSGVYDTFMLGNHDPDISPAFRGEVCSEVILAGMTLRHAPREARITHEIAGHLHPAARVSLYGHTIRRPCFIGNGRRLVLPAFGAYTGGLNVLDAAFMPLFGPDGHNVIVLGQEVSEEPGAGEMAAWLKSFIKDVPVEWIPTGEPAWMPYQA